MYVEEECLLTQTKERSITNKLHETPENSTTDSVDHAKTYQHKTDFLYAHYTRNVRLKKKASFNSLCQCVFAICFTTI